MTLHRRVGQAGVRRRAAKPPRGLRPRRLEMANGRDERPRQKHFKGVHPGRSLSPAVRRGAVRNFVCEAILIFAAVVAGRLVPAAAAAAV